MKVQLFELNYITHLFSVQRRRSIKLGTVQYIFLTPFNSPLHTDRHTHLSPSDVYPQQEISADNNIQPDRGNKILNFMIMSLKTFELGSKTNRNKISWICSYQHQLLTNLYLPPIVPNSGSRPSSIYNYSAVEEPFAITVFLKNMQGLGRSPGLVVLGCDS